MTSTFAFRAVALALGFLAARAPPLRASEETLRTFDTCWKRVRALPRVAQREDVDWSELLREYRPRADAAAPGGELRELLNELIGRIGISHTAVLDRATYRGMMNELAGRPTPTFGVLLEEMEPGSLFVRAMYEGGPAARAGLRVGDEVAAVGGRSALESDEVVDAGYDPRPDLPRLLSLRARSEGDELELLVRSAPRDKLRRVGLVAEATSGLEAGRRSVRVVRRQGARIGIVHLWMVARGSGDLLQDALRGELSGCDALVVDLRGRGGLADEIGRILAPFERGRGRRASRAAAPWTRPVVFLIDGRTRSAKEIAAWHVREARLGPLVGERTEGAVLGAHFVPLPGGLWLELGMQEVPVGDGVSLEGVGVAPTHPAAHPGPFARGFDPILEKGLDLAAASARPARRRGPY
jgi:carboxyl-terminal processing protease